MNRFEQLNFQSSKNMTTATNKYLDVVKEMKDLDITIEKIYVIKLFNLLDSHYEIFLAIVSENARKDVKLLILDSIVERVLQEETRLINADIHMSRVNNERDKREKRTQREDQRDRDRESSQDRDNDSRDDDFSKVLCENCYTHHKSTKEDCSHKNKKCSNCDMTSHIEINCRQSDKERENQTFDFRNSSKNSSSINVKAKINVNKSDVDKISLKEHIDMIKISTSDVTDIEDI